MEGIIQFDLHFRPAPPLEPKRLGTVNAWRRILFQLGLIGRDPARYGGFGYGNISQRLAPPTTQHFVISGTQTGGLVKLGPEHFATVLECRPEENRVTAEGPIKPSAEALTHGAIYSLDQSLQFVMHVHSPEIWRQARHLGLPVTGDVPGGSPALPGEICRLLMDPATAGARLLAMGGHEDGVIAFGRTAEEAGTALLRSLARALGSEE